MNIRTSDCTRAGLIAAVLWGIAAVVFFGIPHGFEEQIGWLYILLPGFLIVAPFSAAIPGTALATCTIWGMTVLISSVFYFGICFAGVKVYHLARKLLAVRM